MEPSFWCWLFRGSGGKQGYRSIINCWILFHIGVGVGLGWMVRIDLTTAARVVLLPLTGVLIGLAFAWAGNAQALLQTSEIERLSDESDGGYHQYVYSYQLAILVILSTIGIWAIAALEIFDNLWPTLERPYEYGAVKVLLFMMASLTVRACWQVVLVAQYMLVARMEVRKSQKRRGDGGTERGEQQVDTSEETGEKL